MVIPALFVGGLFLAVFLRQPNGPEPGNLWVLDGSTMGTAYRVKIAVPDAGGPGKEEAAAVIRRTVDEVNARMSTYRPDSELSLLNRHEDGPFAVSEMLFEVLAEAQRVAEITGGAFDITIGPLVDAWGFGPEPRTGTPDQAAIDRLLEVHGFEGLRLDADGGTVTKANPELRSDLSAIAKGYAVDRVRDELAALGLADLMVEIGGEVAATGRNAEGSVWRIGVERPDAARRGVWSAVELADAAMATSGDYRNYYEVDGVRLSHLIDPRTGRPVTHRLASVSVVHPSCMTADALATALNILGPDEGKTLVLDQGLAALFLIRSPDGGFTEWSSPAWPDGKDSASGTVNPDEDR
jgi:thiamine biosynthesis lipoprotein